MTRLVAASLDRRPVLDAQFALPAGIAPGEGFARLPGEVRLQGAVPRTLTLSDGASRVALGPLFVTRAATEHAPDGTAITRLTLVDRRYRWRFGTLTGAYNVKRADGVTYDPATVKQPAGTPYTLTELVRLALAAMGERAAGATQVPSGDSIAPVNVRWQGENPASALAALLIAHGLDVSITPEGGELRIARRDDLPGALGPDAARIADLTIAENPAIARPGTVVVLGGRTIRERAIAGTWEPVCEGDGSSGFTLGGLYPLADLASAWGLSLADVRRECLSPTGFAGVAGPDASARERRRQLLKRCAYRWYRLPASDRDTLPWLRHRAQTDASGALLPIAVTHTFFRARTAGLGALDDPFENVTTPEESSYARSFDRAQGVVRFTQVQGTLVPASPPVEDTRLAARQLDQGATLVVTPAFEVPLAGAGEPVYRRERQDPRAGDPALVLRLIRPDLVLRQAETASGGLLDLNRAALDAVADSLIDAALRPLPVRRLRRETFAGARAATPVGLRRKVDWRVDPDDGLTTASETLEAPEPVPIAPPPPLDPPRTSANQPEGEIQQIRQVNAYSVGPQVIKVAGSPAGADALLYAEATPASGSAGLTLARLGPTRNPFHLDRSASGGGLGAWFHLSLVAVLSGSEPVYSVAESDEAGVLASGAIAVSATNVGHTPLLPGDLALLAETHNEHKFIVPVDDTLVSDHTAADEATDNRSTEVRTRDGARAGDLDDLTWVKLDRANVERLMLNINSAAGPQSWYTGSGAKTEAIGQLGGDAGVLLAPKDCVRHVQATNADGIKVLEGHLTTQVNFYQDPTGDGPCDFRQVVQTPVDRGVNSKSYLWWDDSTDLWKPVYWTPLLKLVPPASGGQPPVYHPDASGGSLIPNPNGAPASGANPNELGSRDEPWRGLHLGSGLPGAYLKGGGQEVVITPESGDDKTVLRFKDGSQIELASPNDGRPPDYPLLRAVDASGTTSFELSHTAAGDLHFQASGAAGTASLIADNLVARGNLIASGALLPDASCTRDLGAAELRFRDAYLNGQLVADRLNVGTVADAVAQGDFAAGLTGAARMFFDQSAGNFLFTNVDLELKNAYWLKWDGLNILGRSGNDVHFQTNHATGQFVFEAGSPTVQFLSLVPGSPNAAFFGVTITATQDINLSAGKVLAFEGSGSAKRIFASGNLYYDCATASGDHIFRAGTGYAWVLQIANAGYARVYSYLRVGSGTAAAANGDFSAGSATEYVFWDESAETWSQYSGGSLINRLSSVPGTETVFNEQGEDIDTRIESANRANAFLVDAGRDDVQTDGGRRLRMDTISSNTTLTSAYHVVHVDTSGGNVTVTLPSASANAGQVYIIKHGDANVSSGNTCTISRSGSDTIDGALTTLAVTWSKTTVVISDGTSTWRVLGASY